MGNVRIRGDRHEPLFLDMECSLIVLRSCLSGDVIPSRKEFNANGTSKRGRDYSLEKKPLETNRTLVKRGPGRLSKIIGNGISV